MWRGRGIYWLPASSRISTKSSIGNSSAPRSKPYRSHNWLIFMYWNGNQNLVKDIWNQPPNKSATDSRRPNFLPIIGASCNFTEVVTNFRMPMAFETGCWSIDAYSSLLDSCGFGNAGFEPPISYSQSGCSAGCYYAIFSNLWLLETNPQYILCEDVARHWNSHRLLATSWLGPLDSECDSRSLPIPSVFLSISRCHCRFFLFHGCTDRQDFACFSFATVTEMVTVRFGILLKHSYKTLIYFQIAILPTGRSVGYRNRIAVPRPVSFYCGHSQRLALRSYRLLHQEAPLSLDYLKRKPGWLTESEISWQSPFVITICKSYFHGDTPVFPENSFL